MEIKCPHCKKKLDLKISKFKHTCKRCGYEWLPRSEKLPEVCPNPKCKSPYWNKERIRPVKKRRD